MKARFFSADFLTKFFYTENKPNLNKSISACIAAQKQTSESFDNKKAVDFCRDQIKKKLKLE